MPVLTVFPMHPSNTPSPLRHPSHRSPPTKLPSPTFTDRWRNRMRSDLVARVKSAREKSANDARGGDDEIMRVIFRGEEKRRIAKMEREASLIHRETLERVEEIQEEEGPDEALLDELLRKEEEEVLALLASMEEEQGMEDDIMEDIVMD